MDPVASVNSFTLRAALIICLLSTFFVVSLPADNTYAQGVFSPNTGEVSVCLNHSALQGKVIGKIAFCFRNLLTHVTEVFVVGITRYATPIIWAIFTLAITIYGVRISIMSFGSLQSDTMVFLLKAAFVIFFAFNIDVWIPAVFGAADQLVGLVVDYLNSGLRGPMGRIGSLCAPSPPYLLGVDMRVWNALDCYAGRIIGYGPQYGFGSGITSILFAMAMSGGIGFVAAILTVISCAIVVRFMYLSLFQIFAAYLTISMMLMVAPLLFPLLLFRSEKGTAFKYFQGWLNILLGSVLTPMFVVAFTVFFMAVVDTVMFRGMSYGSVTFSTMDAVFNTQPGEDPAKNISKILRENQTVYTLKVPTDPTFVGSMQKVAKKLEKWFSIDMSVNVAVGDWVAGFSPSDAEFTFGNTYTSLDFSTIDKSPGATEKRLRNLTYTMAALMIISAAGFSFINAIPAMIESITRSGATMISLGVRGLFRENELISKAASVVSKAGG